MKAAGGTTFGPILVGAWLILWGLLSAPFLKLSFEHSGDVLSGLAIAAGLAVALRR